jgi:CheY-like chemotaxis protein
VLTTPELLEPGLKGSLMAKSPLRLYRSFRNSFHSGPLTGMSGLELQAKLNAEHCRIPTIFITAHGDTKMRMQALRAGAVEFLAKPFDDDALLGSVRAALES